MLTPERIDAEAFARWGDMKGAPLAMCRGFARAIELEVCKQYDALILQLVEALESSHATLWEEDDDPSRPAHAAIAAARAHLLDSDLSKLTERGVKAWAGVDAQKLREGKAP